MKDNDDYIWRDSNLVLNGASRATSTIVSPRALSTDEESFLDELDRKARVFPANVRSESERIALDASKKLDALKRELENELRSEREALERRADELEVARKTLEGDLQELEERRASLESETFERAKKDGYQSGFEVGAKDGFKSGEQRADKEFETRVANAVDAELNNLRETALEPLRSLVREMNGTRRNLLKNWEENIMQIAAAIAYQTILREPSLTKAASVDLLREALELAMNCATLKIRMNPADVDSLRKQIRAILEETGNLAKSEVVPDPKITQGGCLVETSLGVVDERLESRLERIVAELSD